VNNAFVLSQCCVSLAILGAACTLGYAKLRRDNFRSEMRRLRDGLFDFMWQHGYSFDTPAYRDTRQLLNGIIRISGKLAPMSFLVAVSFATRSHSRSPAYGRPADEALARELERVRHVAADALLRFVFLGGLFGLFLRAVLWLLSAVHLAMKAKQWAVLAAREFLLPSAYAMGDPDPCAPGPRWLADASSVPWRKPRGLCKQR
jgi:hypothetical protein